MNMKNPYVLTAGAFLSAWAATNFQADYRAILWAVLAGVFGAYAVPTKNTPASNSDKVNFIIFSIK